MHRWVTASGERPHFQGRQHSSWTVASAHGHLALLTLSRTGLELESRGDSLPGLTDAVEIRVGSTRLASDRPFSLWNDLFEQTQRQLILK